MRPIILIISIICFGVVNAFGQTTATDFTTNDCTGTSHHLFAELEAGKIIVVSFVMPCSGCVGPALSAKNIVDGYATSNPGRVVFYLADDLANTTCATLQSWASTNSIHAVIFSDPSFVMSSYGGIAMPKTVVLAGADHKIIFTEDNTLTPANMQAAINTYLATTGVVQPQKQDLGLTLFPNPAANSISVAYTLSAASSVSIEIFNATGSKVKTILSEENTGTKEININLDGKLSNGLYFLKLNTGAQYGMTKFIVSN